MSNPNVCLQLRVKCYLSNGCELAQPCETRITAYDDASSSGTHFRVDFEVKHAGEVIFPRGQLWVRIPVGHGTDSLYAKEAVLSSVAMKPTYPDDDFFADYTPEQLAWVKAHGDALNSEREDRYCDENGNPRRSA